MAGRPAPRISSAPCMPETIACVASHDRSTEKSGGETGPLRHTGHFPGFLSRSRFSKRNPQLAHSAGRMISRLPARWSDVRMCSRWAYTSLSGIPTRPEISLPESGPFASSATIRWRTVSCASSGICSCLRAMLVRLCRSSVLCLDSTPSSATINPEQDAHCRSRLSGWRDLPLLCTPTE